MTTVSAPAGVRRLVIEAQVIRADGTREEPKVTYWHANPLRRAWFRLTGRVT